MANLLHQSASGICSHGGNARPIIGNPRVRILGVPALTVLSQLSLAGCPNNPSGVSPLPCTIAMYTTGARRVKLMNAAMLLSFSMPTNIPTGASTTITRAQPRAKGM